MARVELILGLLTAVVWIYSIVTCALADPAVVKYVPKPVWLIGIVLLPLLGSVLWLGVGRERRPRAAAQPPVGPPVPRTYSAMTSDERIRRMEEDLARLERENDEGSAPRG